MNSCLRGWVLNPRIHEPGRFPIPTQLVLPHEPPLPAGVALHLTEALQLLLFTGLFSQGAEQSKELRARRGSDVQEEGESLAQRAGGQPGVPNPAGGWATWGWYTGEV